jgi:hypothetical protein
MALSILTTNNAKIQKNKKVGYLSAGIHFAPHTLSGRNVCAAASVGCAASCLNTSGRGIYKNVQEARLKKTKRFFDDKEKFMEELVANIETVIRKAARMGLNPSFRLNLTSDLSPALFTHKGRTVLELFPHVQFMDYTKVVPRMIKYLKGEFPKNYHLTFSRSESNGAQAELIANMGGNVAVVFDELPAQYLGRKVVSGDDSDARWLDGDGVIVGLKAKGKAKKDESGFVVRLANAAKKLQTSKVKKTNQKLNQGQN